jgi:hypothetical protein
MIEGLTANDSEPARVAMSSLPSWCVVGPIFAVTSGPEQRLFRHSFN